MPLYGCKSCHHEWEGPKNEVPICDWCNATGYVLEAKTDLEKMTENTEGLLDILEKFSNQIRTNN